MKKLVLFAVAAVAISFASCTNKSNEGTAPEADTTAQVAVEAVEEVAVADSAAEVVEEVAVETPAAE